MGWMSPFHPPRHDQGRSVCPKSGRCRSLSPSVIGSIILPPGLGAPGRAPRLLTPAQWAADLKFLAETVPAKHRHAFDRVKRRGLRESRGRSPKPHPHPLRDQEIIVGMARLVAIIRDGHSRLTLPLGSGEAVMPGHMATAPAKEGLYLRVLPVKLLWLSDGLFVQAAAKAQRKSPRRPRAPHRDHDRRGRPRSRPARGQLRQRDVVQELRARRCSASPRSSTPRRSRTRPSEAALTVRLRDGRETTVAPPRRRPRRQDRLGHGQPDRPVAPPALSQEDERSLLVRIRSRVPPLLLPDQRHPGQARRDPGRVLGPHGRGRRGRAPHQIRPRPPAQRRREQLPEPDPRPGPRPLRADQPLRDVLRRDRPRDVLRRAKPRQRSE